MLTADFKHGNVIGTVRRWHPTVSAFDAALYTQKLMDHYGINNADISGAFEINGTDVTVRPEAAANSRIIAAITIITDIAEFSNLAAHITKMHGAGYDWPKSNAKPDKIDVAFRHLLEDDELRQYIRAEADKIDNPNGDLGPADLLTDEQKSDFLSESAVASSLNSNGSA